MRARNKRWGGTHGGGGVHFHEEYKFRPGRRGSVDALEAELLADEGCAVKVELELVAADRII